MPWPFYTLEESLAIHRSEAQWWRDVAAQYVEDGDPEGAAGAMGWAEIEESAVADIQLQMQFRGSMEKVVG